MIFTDLRGLIDKVYEHTDVKLSISRLSEETGIHRKILSKIYNHPLEKVTSDTLKGIIEYFFHIFRHSEFRPKETDLEIMQWVTNQLVVVFPDEEIYRKLLPKTLQVALENGEISPRYAWMYLDKVQRADKPNMKDSNFKEFSESPDLNENEEEDMYNVMVEELFKSRKRSNKKK